MLSGGSGKRERGKKRGEKKKGMPRSRRPWVPCLAVLVTSAMGRGGGEGKGRKKKTIFSSPSRRHPRSAEAGAKGKRGEKKEGKKKNLTLGYPPQKSRRAY